MPRADPACRMVSFRAEPTPALFGGIVPISAPTAAGMARPAPRPSRPRPVAGTANPVVAETMASRPNAPAITSIPPSTSNLWPIFAPALAPRRYPPVRHGQRDEGESRFDRRVAEDELEVLGEHQQQAAGSDLHQGEGQRPAAEVARLNRTSGTIGSL